MLLQLIANVVCPLHPIHPFQCKLCTDANMETRAVAEDEARQPLLSNQDDCHRPANQEQLNSHAQTDSATKDDPDDPDQWHWLERLIFKTRLRFYISVCVFFVFWTLIACLEQSPMMPWHDRRWPWNKHPDYNNDVGFWRALSRLEDQPFCLPDPELLQPSDISLDRDDLNAEARCASQVTFRLDNGTASVGAFSRLQLSSLFNWIGADFDSLAGSTVREQARRSRESVQLVMSIAGGEPFYTRNASTAATSKTERSFRSLQLWRALQRLSLSLQHHSGQAITVEALLVALQMDNSRVVSDPSRTDDASLEIPVVETTLFDTHKFVQSLAATYHGLTQSSNKTLLDQRVVRDYLGPKSFNTDGNTANTRSTFSTIQWNVRGRGDGALYAVGRRNFFNSMQRAGRSLHFHVLNEVYSDQELSILLDLHRGVVMTASAHLVPFKDDQPSSNNGTPQWGQSERSTNVWDWMRESYANIQYELDSFKENRRWRAVGGTYRFDKHASRSSAESVYDWLEVDIELSETALWITRIEYAPAGNQSTSGSGSGSSLSVLKKYNAGGTADFFAGWTCADSIEKLADCYRPRMGDDDSACFCTQSKFGTRSSYRVGLWRLLASHNHTIYEIPRGEVRLDTYSYMDQAQGGCPALWNRFNVDPVPEIESLGYKIKLTEPVHFANGSVAHQAELEWLDSALTLTRIRSTEPRY